MLQGLGATPRTPVTILSDGADGPRSLGEAACVGPTRHVFDWFHLAMRIHHVAQAAKGWPADTPGDREDGARLADAVERIRWRLWHGQGRCCTDPAGGAAGRAGEHAKSWGAGPRSGTSRARRRGGDGPKAVRWVRLAMELPQPGVAMETSPPRFCMLSSASRQRQRPSGSKKRSCSQARAANRR